MGASRALVIGGSLGGLMVAHLLRSTGWDAAVFERNDEELASRGVGLGTHPQLIAILKRAGIDFDESMGITPPRGVCLDGNGKIIIEQPMARTLSGWSRLYDALLDALPAGTYRFGKRLTRVEQNADGVTAIFRRRQQRARRSPGRRRRHPLHGARAISARRRAGLCRLCRLARRARRSRRAAGPVARNGRALCLLPARGRATDQLRGAGAGQRYGRRPPRLQYHLVPADRSPSRSPIFAPTPAAGIMPPAFRRR